MQAPGGQYLTFRVARVGFAMEASRLRGILPARDLEPIQPSRRLSQLLGREPCGFARHRGQEVPVFDLRGRLNLPHGTHGRNPCIIVVEIAATEGARLAGFVADRVGNVIKARERDFANGKLYLGGRPLRVLDPEFLLAPAPGGVSP